MDKAIRFIVFGIVLLVLLLFMTTYTVRYDQYSLVTTFGSVSESSYEQREGLHWKLPTPIQQVRRFDKRVRVLETRLEDHQTRDKQQITVQAFLAWRISDPVRYFQSYSGRRADRQAEDNLSSRMKTAMGTISEYDFQQLLAPMGSESMLDEVERKVMERVLQSEGEAQTMQEQYGIEVLAVGITRIILPESTTTKVFERMRVTRNNLAATAAERGKAAKAAIVGRASADAQKILAFAGKKAAEIKAQGAEEAGQWLAMQAQDEQLAVFSRSMEMFETMVSKQTTLIFSKGDFPFDLLDPGALEAMKNERGIPVPNNVQFPGAGSRDASPPAAEEESGS
jgi:modulator of FtsH protease HflC